MTTDPANPEPLVCAGEFFLDLIFFDLEAPPALGQELKTDNFAISLGGGAAITASAAARLGRSAELVTVWGESMLDVEARRQLKKNGVSFSGSRTRQDSMSGLSVAVSTREDRYFLTYPGANKWLQGYLLRPETLAQIGLAGHVHFALNPGRWGPFLTVVKQLRAQGVTVSWDLGWDPAAGRSPGFRRLCRHLDLLFLNDMEARKYAAARSLRQALAFFSHGDNTVVIKRGAAGAVASYKAAPAVRVDGIDVDAVESTGAGDAFNGGFLHAWMAGKAVEEALLWANICGGLSTRSPGGMQALPTRTEFERQLEHLTC